MLPRRRSDVIRAADLVRASGTEWRADTDHMDYPHADGVLGALEHLPASTAPLARVIGTALPRNSNQLIFPHTGHPTLSQHGSGPP